MSKIKNKTILIIYTVTIGFIIGTLIWLFLKANKLGIELLWDYIPSKIKIPFYPLVICLIGGIITGLWKRKYGDFPEELNEVVKELKTKGRYKYDNIISKIISSLLPLLIGASVGPESGLVGIIAGLCTWAKDKLKTIFKEIEELTFISVSATLGTIFKSPMFGFIEPIENENQIPKSSKTVIYFISILSAFGTFSLLNKIFSEQLGFENLGKTNANINWIYILMFIIIGIILSLIYKYTKKIIQKILKPLKDNILIKCIIGSILLGITGMILPLTMFSGEDQINVIIQNGIKIGVPTLIIISIFKIILTNICIETGLKGGHFFPMIFSGITLGYSLSIILNYDPIITMATVTSSLLGSILKKPIAPSLLLMIIFPANLVPLMLLSSTVSVLFTSKNSH